ncbi:MAG: arginine repressor [Salinivirgaceae bacterium]|jgi:transcriptional regulator of arginine metabolism|nr:arginine repressor [Salinivirgaceae bacterium]
MDSKSLRLTEIKKIIQNEQVTSQESLLKTLVSKEFHVTQATLSRDLKLLKVAKMPDGSGSYRYILPNAIANTQRPISADRRPLDGFLSIEINENVGVIHTLPAYSHTISSEIDAQGINPIAGTIAGEDTIIFIIRAGYTGNDVKEALLKEFPNLIDKLL